MSDETENAVLIGSGIGLLLIGVVVVWVAVHGSAAIDGRPAPPGNPAMMIAAMVHGEVAWTATTNWLLAFQVLIILLVAAGVAWLIMRGRGKRLRGDSAAKLMGTGRAIGQITTARTRAEAGRLGVKATGILVGRTVAGNQAVWQGWEDVSVDIWGPRQGKTTSRVIPAIVSAPGTVVVTSNKRDVVDATRHVRTFESGNDHQRDTVPLVFDPQQIAGQQPSWWWNPLTYVTGEVTASKMAHVLVSSARPVGAKTDAFFDAAAEELIACLLLAAASMPRGSFEYVYLWLTQPTSTAPVDILADKRHALMASALYNHVNSPDKQRDGVFGTARTLVRFMTSPEIMAWVTPPSRGGVTEFKPHQFVRDTKATLYLLSKEGHGSAGPIMTALTVAITEAAEQYSQEQPGGRLPTPMLLALDEAANICRWDELPNLYSHFGSRGIIPMTILQSWAQGEEVWGKAGMTKLWSAATIKVVGSGVGGGTFLSDLSALIGEWEKPARSYQSGHRGTGPSHTSSRQRERIMDVADIAALPRGRAIVIGAAARPALCRTIAWMDTDAAAAIGQSIAKCTPHIVTADEKKPIGMQ